jgi:hypothetical protein
LAALTHAEAIAPNIGEIRTRHFESSKVEISDRGIARGLNAMGLRTRTGSQWDKNSVVRVIGHSTEADALAERFESRAIHDIETERRESDGDDEQAEAERMSRRAQLFEQAALIRARGREVERLCRGDRQPY